MIRSYSGSVSESACERMNFWEHPEPGPRWIYHTMSLLLAGSIPFILFFFRKHRWL